MQFSDYLASGGLERLLIIVGALLIGYWGYRIHARAQTAGLALLGLAGTVLLAALFTATPFAHRAETLAGQPSAAPAHVATHDRESPEPLQGASAASADVTAGVDEPTAEPSSPSAASEPPAPASAAEEKDQATALVSGDELGGRIVAVRGGNVSLEWTSAQEAKQQSRDAQPPPAVSPPPSP